MSSDWYSYLDFRTTRFLLRSIPASNIDLPPLSPAAHIISLTRRSAPLSLFRDSRSQRCPANSCGAETLIPATYNFRAPMGIIFSPDYISLGSRARGPRSRNEEKFLIRAR